VDLYWPSSIEFDLPEGISGETLFSSTPDAWRMTRDFAIRPELNYLFTQEEPDTRGVKILGAALSGVFPSWFKDVEKPSRDTTGDSIEEDPLFGLAGAVGAAELPDMPPEPRESRIVVIGDTDLAGPLIQYTRSDRNLDFLLQAADWLGNDDDIVGIRNRQSDAGRLNRIADPVKRAGAMAFSRLFNTIFIPLVIILLGIFRWWKRRAVIKGKERSDVA
jgi:ABC-type uncharacterized transport system involved in gliding motility auxiliary subunit